MTPKDIRILGISFHKEMNEIAFYDFEKLLIFEVGQMLNFFTQIEFLDYAIPSHRLAWNPQLLAAGDGEELCHWARQYACNYILCGKLEPEVGPTGYLDGITLEMYLFDVDKSRFALNVSYYFTAFSDHQPKTTLFTPSWEGLQELKRWMLQLICGAICPEKSNFLWHRLQGATLANNLPSLQTLARAFYLNHGEEGLADKFTMFNNLVQDEPGLFLAHLELGHIHKRMQSYTGAIQSFEKAFQLMTDASPRQQALCITELGVCQALSGSTDKAQEWWQAAIGTDPTLLNPYMNLAHALEEIGQISEAERYFKLATEVAPDDVRVYGNLARLYSKLEMWEKAINQYERQLDLDPEDAWACSNLANCYLQKGSIREAKSYLMKTVEIDPEGEAGKCAYFILSGLQAVEV